MITDDERREVARRLRDSAEERMSVKGKGNGNNWSWLYRSIFGHHMETKKVAKGRYVEVAHRLADLIEPTRTCSEPTRTCRRCDRKAPLALADEMVGFGDEIDRTIRRAGVFADSWESRARRFRKASGVGR